MSIQTTLKEQKALVSARLEAEQARELERRAAEDDRSVSWFVRQAVDRYLKTEGESMSLADWYASVPEGRKITSATTTTTFSPLPDAARYWGNVRAQQGW